MAALGMNNFIYKKSRVKEITIVNVYSLYFQAAENFYESAENSTKVNVSAAMTLVPTHTDINNKIEDIFVSINNENIY